MDWISVDQRLPDSQELVAIILKVKVVGGETLLVISMGTYDDDTGFWTDVISRDFPAYPEYWLPFPPLPE